MNSSSIYNPITTITSNVDTFFKKLYLKQIVSPDASTEIIDLLSSSQINDRILEKLPQEFKIVHKTGELPLVRNDIDGSVYLDKNPYIYCLA